MMLALLDDADSCRDGTFRSLLRSSGASGRCRGLLQVLLEKRPAATAGTSSKDAYWSPDPTTRQSFLRLVLFCGRNSPLIRPLGRHVRWLPSTIANVYPIQRQSALEVRRSGVLLSAVNRGPCHRPLLRPEGAMINLA